MNKHLHGKTAVVTGGTRGIGFAIAERLLHDGAQVAICGRNSPRVVQSVTDLAAKTGGKVFGRAADVSNLEQVQELFQFVDKKLGSLDILINNAGIGVYASVSQMNPADWRRTLDTNLTGVFYCCHEALPRF